ncbi:MAG: hypothetical protein Q8S33_29730 [Myxococcales bacterium]|nr:hypothetical protein [Myxococcales bacterium]
MPLLMLTVQLPGNFVAMRRRFIAVLLVAGCSAPSATDAGAFAGGGAAVAGGAAGGFGGGGGFAVAGGAAGGLAGGPVAGGVAGGSGGGGMSLCDLRPARVPGCPCGAGGGASLLSDRLILASRSSDNDAGLVTVSAARLGGVSSVFLPGLTGVPVALAGASFGPLGGGPLVIAVKGDDTPAQMWTGQLDGPSGFACDPAESLPSVTRGAGMARLLGNELWYVRRPGTVVRAADDFMVTTSFASPGRSLGRFAYDSPNDRLFACEPDAGSIAVWRNTRMQSGDAGVQDFELQIEGVRALEASDGRLYAATGSPSQVRVWNGVATLNAPRPHDFVLSLDGGAVTHLATWGGRLVVTVQTSSTGRVLLYENISAVTADRAPSAVIEHSALAGATKSVLTSPQFSPPSGRLLVLTESAVVAFDQPFTAPTAFTVRDAGLGVAIDLLHFL